MDKDKDTCVHFLSSLYHLPTLLSCRHSETLITRAERANETHSKLLMLSLVIWSWYICLRARVCGACRFYFSTVYIHLNFFFFIYNIVCVRFSLMHFLIELIIFMGGVIVTKYANVHNFIIILLANANQSMKHDIRDCDFRKNYNN